MKVGARNTLIDTAEKNNIPWRLLSRDLKGKMDILDDNFNNIVDSTISYPSYYTQEFHAYSEGNLNWEAACECESATMSMAIRTWPKESLSVKQAQDRLRNSFTDAIKEYSQGSLSSSLVSTVKSPFQVQRAIDIGCSVGVSTFYLAEAFPEAESILGLDLSPHFLAVARGRQMRQCGLDFIGKIENENENENDADSDELDTDYDRIQWKHANIENTDIPDNHYDLVACSFVFHELPSDASQTVLNEMHRIAKPGGVVAITDINPGSAVIQNLPPAIFTMMKSTEPWSDQYYALDLVEALQQAGFEDTLSTPTDPQHHTILGRKPLAEK
eukprot:CAMPEP_0174970580 /NCGR_PEP_ID=MMETSP0004_2-20121128/9469_1 /TAXON_ID=420556 /ORGANISM="Ochromonas sp., Strain CCMP1393" /LENGTH=328 /DNA_ID=CAMNT_0016220341 /DNA_START=216 /DNA_END=1202 /DNA_ORIENTATION=+